jgi:hypothetical protein
MIMIMTMISFSNITDTNLKYYGWKNKNTLKK